MSTKEKRTKTGRVIKQSGNQTICVVIEGLAQHPQYKKTIKTRRKFIVHDPKNEASVGDTVTIMESRPISKLKSWVLKEVKSEG